MYPQRSVMTCGLATALEPPHFNHAPVRGATPAPDLRIRGRVVSIHAPAWGATHFFVPNRLIWDVSIHAPAWGATRSKTVSSRDTKGFNPRTRVGCDTCTKSSARDVPRFQSTHPRGVRHAVGYGRRSLDGTFQSTHPRGVRRPKPRCGRTTVMCFNPRTRVGCD